MANDAAAFFAGSTLSRDLFDLVTGEKLGEGTARQVFAYAMDEKLAIKFEGGRGSFQNVSEWELWSWVGGTKMAKWFAPCRHISACGTILLQDRCEPIQLKQLPKRLPSYLADLKKENFGMLNGRVVCCDYGMALSAIRSVPKRMQKAVWR
jgi:hypothetical protein